MTQALTHYLQFKDLTADDYVYLFSRAAFIKHKFKKKLIKNEIKFQIFKISNV